TPEPTRGFLGEGGEESLTARFDSGESQQRCRPRAGPLLPGEQSQTQRVTRRLAKKPGALNVASLEYLVVPAEAGIQAKSGAPCAQRPIGVGEHYRCSPPSEPYGRFSRIRLSGQWLSTSRLALKSVS